MNLFLLTLFILYLGIMWYIIETKDTKFAIFFIKLLIFITLVKMFYIWYYVYQGQSICQIIKNSWNCK